MNQNRCSSKCPTHVCIYIKVLLQFLLGCTRKPLISTCVYIQSRNWIKKIIQGDILKNWTLIISFLYILENHIQVDIVIENRNISSSTNQSSILFGSSPCNISTREKVTEEDLEGFPIYLGRARRNNYIAWKSYLHWSLRNCTYKQLISMCVYMQSRNKIKKIIKGAILKNWTLIISFRSILENHIQVDIVILPQVDIQVDIGIYP